MTELDDSTRHALRARLRELIAVSAPGDRLPSERELSLRWGVARMTVRHAMDALVAEGLVERRHGSGTFVLPRTPLRFLGLTSFTQDMRDRGLEPASRLVAFGVSIRGPGPRVAAAVPAGERVVGSPGSGSGAASRWRRDGVDPRLARPGLEPGDLEGSLYALLAPSLRHRHGRGERHHRARAARPRDRAHLAITDDQACLRLQDGRLGHARAGS